MRAFFSAGVIFGGTAFFVACARSGPAATLDGGAAATTTIANATTSAAPLASGVAAPVVPPANMTIPERFNAEASHRPTGVVRAEDATAAFRKAGVTLDEEKQHLASFYKAAYCVGAKAKGEEISFSVCEYTDGPGAAAGKQLNDKAFSPIKNRSSYVNGGTTLTILESVKTPENDALVKTLVDTFNALKSPTPAK